MPPSASLSHLDSRVYVHAVGAVVCPVLGYIALTNPLMPRWQRGFLLLCASASFVMDGYALAKWIDTD